MSESKTTSLSVQVVSITGYLLGVQEEIFNKEYKTSIFQTLEEKPEAKILRSLSIIRNTLIRHFGKICVRFRNEAFCNLDKIPDLLDPEVLTYLHSQGVSILKANEKPMQYMLTLNTLINDRINNCKSLYPMWVEWTYIKKLFQMPKGGVDKHISKVIDKFHDSMNSYPYHCYMNWPIDNPRAYSETPNDNGYLTKGNVLQNDKRFLCLLYHINGQEFTDLKKVTDIGEEVRNDLKTFLQEANRIVLAVDCENSDPYKLCAVLQGFREVSLRNNESESKIEKIILYDDVHTVDAWGILKNYVNVPIEHIETERVNEHKSLVDVQMTAGVAKEHFKNAVDSFLLASSDSDFWGLIKSLPSARFFVLLEKDKYGTYLTDALELNNIGYCLMDDFAGNTDEIKKGAMDKLVQEYLEDTIQLELAEKVNQFYEDLRVNMTDKQKDVYYTRLIKRIGVDIKDGILRVGLRD